MAFFGGGGASVSNMVGATSSVAGTAGLVPAPAAGEESGLLRGDATFLKSFLFKQSTYLSTFSALGAVAQGSATNAGLQGNWIANDANFILFYFPDTFEFNRIGFPVQIWPSTQNVEFGVYSCDQKIPLFPKTRVSVETIAVASATTEVSLSTTWSASGFFYLAIRFAGTHNTHTTMGVNAIMGFGSSSYGLKDASYTARQECGAYIAVQNGQSSSLPASYASNQAFISIRTTAGGVGPFLTLRKV